MPSYRDEAVVLRTYKLGEADRIIILLTLEHGKVRAVAKGVRRTSSKFGARLEPLSHVDVQLLDGKSLETITQAVTINAFGASLVTDYPAYTAAQIMAETVDKIIQADHEPAVGQYRLLVGALTVLTSQTWDGPRPASMIVDSFLLRSLALAGYAPRMLQCVFCGQEEELRWFSISDGGMCCLACRPQGAIAIPQDQWRYLIALGRGDWPNTRTVGDYIEQRSANLIAEYTTWHLDHHLRSLSIADRRTSSNTPIVPSRF